MFKEGIRHNMRMELIKLRNFRLEKVGEFFYSSSILNITNMDAFLTSKQRNVTLRVTIVLVCSCSVLIYFQFELKFKILLLRWNLMLDEYEVVIKHLLAGKNP